MANKPRCNQLLDQEDEDQGIRQHKQKLQSIEEELGRIRASKPSQANRRCPKEKPALMEIAKQLWRLASEIIGGLTISFTFWTVLNLSSTTHRQHNAKSANATQSPIKATLVCIGVIGGLYSYIKQLHQKADKKGQNKQTQKDGRERQNNHCSK